MAGLQETINRSLRQLRDMTLSQKLSIALGVMLVGVSLLWIGQWAATPESVALLPGQTLSAEELTQLQAGLEAIGVRSTISGGQLMVPASSSRAALLAQLGVQGSLPRDTSIGFEALVKEANPWISQEENNKRWTVGQQNMLAEALRSLQGVQDARVFLNLNSQYRGFSRTQPAASASVMLFMRHGEPVSRSLALTAARLVAGAVRGLALRNVEVLDGGGAVALEWDEPESSATGQLNRMRRELEQQLAGTIRTQIAFDPLLRVSVRVELDPTSREKNAQTPIEGVEKRVVETRSDSNRGTPAEPPGVQPNVGATTARGGVAERMSEESRESELAPGVEQISERTGAGDVRSIFAAVNVSYSALLNIYRRVNGPDKQPTPEEIEEIFRTQQQKIVKQVQRLVKPQDAEQIAVEWYYDDLPAPMQGAGGAPAASALAMDFAQRYGASAGLGLLALLALGMMVRMARAKENTEAFGLELGLPKEAIEAARRARQDIGSRVGRAAAGGAAAAAGRGEAEAAIPIPTTMSGDEVFLEGQEVDESVMQLSKMLEQVGQMAESDPDGMAAMVEKWIGGK